VTVRIALPKGKLLDETAAFLEQAGWQLNDYSQTMRNYRLKSARFPEMLIKVFQEKDIPIQVAIGNYDLGICGLEWIEELTSKYAAAAPVKIRNLDYGRGALYIAANSAASVSSLKDLAQEPEIIRIVSEYPNIAEAFALNLRLRRFRVYPVWGAAEAYPPENATLALVAGSPDENTLNNGLKPLAKVLDFSAYLIANRASWQQKDLSEVMGTLENVQLEEKKILPTVSTPTVHFVPQVIDKNTVRLALPDGHAQKHTVQLLNKAGIQVDDYPSKKGNRRPTTNLEGVVIKVIRPQDMPLQVANDNFDLAITGIDWLTDHLDMFPGSPVQALVDFKVSRVKIVAAVAGDVPVNNIYDYRQLCQKNESSVRIASEYVNIADKYARDNRLGMYRVLPTWGATEAFIPEDADILIENTETGSTIARHNLKIIDTLFESTAHLIGAKNREYSTVKKARIENLIKLLNKAAESK
jgi:ATP phosphoribosyltransferase